MPPEWNPDPIHMLFLAGLMSTISAAISHVITKWRLSERFMTREETTEHIKNSVEVTIKEVMANCVATQSMCPIRRAIIDLDELKRIQSEFPAHDVMKDIADIKKVQSERTDMLKKQTRTLFELLRVMLDELKVPIDRQNKMLRGLS